MQQRIQIVTPVPVRRVGADGRVAPDERAVPAEAPVAVSFLGIGYAVMMATPADLEDFAIGFARAERLIDDVGDVTGIEVAEAENGLLLGIELVPERHDRVLRRVRHRVSETSCGMCGIENLDQALRPLPRVPAPAAIAPAAIFTALQSITAHQPLNAASGAVHAAAWCGPSGEVLVAREDVGRHNAFDKLVGHLMRAATATADGFALLTARCSYELVEKAALAGMPLLATISAPTDLAVRRAEEAGLTLVSLARPDSFLLTVDPHDLLSLG
jgi:FdhD protein